MNLPIDATPPETSRPLQFIPAFEVWCGATAEGISANLQTLLELGVGGIVVTVDVEHYLRDDSAWEVLRRGIDIGRDLGLRIWIYDEKGYPSGGAGGLVLNEYPAGEAQGLVRQRDANGRWQYEPVRLYEGTHATENFYEQRPYINILDTEAVARFLHVTHDQYARVLEPISRSVEAFFTDEPSLISAYIPNGKDYPPTLPWHPRLPEVFRSRKGYDLTSRLGSLFEDEGPEDRKTRCDFYEVVADLCAESYFGQLQDWCSRHHVLSSGHLLGEETLVWQTLFEGDPFPCYRRFDVPGIDMILSDPLRIMRETFFLVPILCRSATRLQGKRRVMCEISDYVGAVEHRHASLRQMQCTAALLYGLGVTDLVSMYTPPMSPQPDAKDRWPGPAPYSAAEYRAYNDFVARLHAMFSECRIDAHIAVVHPSRSIWAHFTPSHRSMYEPHPNPDVRMMDEAFTNLCRDLLQSQLRFDLVDEWNIVRGEIADGALTIGGCRYSAIVLPPLDTIGVRTLETIAAFAGRGGVVLSHDVCPRYATEGPEMDERVKNLMAGILAHGPDGSGVVQSGALANTLQKAVRSDCVLTPESRSVLVAHLVSTAGHTYLLTNVSETRYTGTALFFCRGEATLFVPASGSSGALESRIVGEGSEVRLALEPLQAVFVSFR